VQNRKAISTSKVEYILLLLYSCYIQSESRGSGLSLPAPAALLPVLTRVSSMRLDYEHGRWNSWYTELQVSIPRNLSVQHRTRHCDTRSSSQPPPPLHDSSLSWIVPFRHGQIHSTLCKLWPRSLTKSREPWRNIIIRCLIQCKVLYLWSQALVRLTYLLTYLLTYAMV
jgi:hypothetical protein